MALLAFAALAFLAERQSVRLTESIEVSVAFLPLLFAAVVFGPLGGAFVGASAVLINLGRPYIRWVIWTSSRTLIGALAGLSAHEAALIHANPFAKIVLATAAAAVADLSLDLVLNSTTLVLRRTGTARDLAKAMAPVVAAGIPLYTLVVGSLAYAYTQLTVWSAALFFIPALAAQRLFILYRRQCDATRDLAEANAQLERANLSFATALVATLDARDRYTAGHSSAVAVYARDIANELGLSKEEGQLAHLCGLVHDIGKVGLPGGLLEKSGPLTTKERHQMEEHAAIGERILRNVETYTEIAAVVRHHHERADGRGYPDGLTLHEIPLLSRIIAVADAYDAMTSDRPYRDALPITTARRRLADAVGTQFDPRVVGAFEAVLAATPYPARRFWGAKRSRSHPAPASLHMAEVG